MMPKSLLYGVLAGWTADPSIAWGASIRNPQGVAIVWDTSGADAIVWDTAGSDAIVWDTAIMTSPDPR
jgi:hypothetical protein